MQDDLISEVRQAIWESKEARDLFTKAMYNTAERLGYSVPNAKDIREKQRFGEPASEDSIGALEHVLNIKLPPSYRAFLMINDGWKVVDGSQSFFSIKQLLKWRERKDPSDWIAIAKENGDQFVEDCIVIGASDNSPDKYLLNPTMVNKDGEFQFIEYTKDGYEIYDSFLDYLRATKDQFAESIKEVDFGEYIDPFAED